MPRLPIAAALLALALGAAPLAAQGAPPGFKEEFLMHFQASTSKLVELAQAMPDSTFTWSPGPGVMPVGRVYAHIARYNYYYPQVGLGVQAPAGMTADSLETRVASRAEVVELLRRSVDHVKRTVEAMPESQLARPARLYGRDVTQWAVLLQLLAHMNEHLGQSIAYARMNDVVPPWSR